jgi:hypothetical protein
MFVLPKVLIQSEELARLSCLSEYYSLPGLSIRWVSANLDSDNLSEVSFIVFMNSFMVFWNNPFAIII